MSNDIGGVTRILSTGAGTYRKWGRTADRQTLCAEYDDRREWYVAGYVIETFEKYGVKFDGSVFVESIICLAGATDAKLTLIPGADHSDVKRVIKKNDEFFDWLSK